jgi:hypothetical protein
MLFYYPVIPQGCHPFNIEGEVRMPNKTSPSMLKGWHREAMTG